MSEKQSIDAEALQGKAVALTAMSLERRGCEIVGSGLRRNGFPFDIVARDGKETAFVEVSVGRDRDSFLERDGDAVREMREAAAAYVEGDGPAAARRGGTRIDVVREARRRRQRAPEVPQGRLRRRSRRTRLKRLKKPKPARNPPMREPPSHAIGH